LKDKEEEQKNFIFTLRIFGELSAYWRYGGGLLSRSDVVASAEVCNKIWRKIVRLYLIRI
jgi:hypothetical protein